MILEFIAASFRIAVKFLIRVEFSFIDIQRAKHALFVIIIRESVNAMHTVGACAFYLGVYIFEIDTIKFIQKFNCTIDIVSFGAIHPKTCIHVFAGVIKRLEYLHVGGIFIARIGEHCDNVQFQSVHIVYLLLGVNLTMTTIPIRARNCNNYFKKH
jgi:hypothetical protein